MCQCMGCGSQGGQSEEMKRRQGMAWKNRMIRTVIMIVLTGILVFAASAGERSYHKERCVEITEIIKTMLVKDKHGGFEPAGNENSADEANYVRSWVTAVKAGDIETLAGVPFGTEFDYDKFEQCEWSDDSVWYRRKDDAQDRLMYTFDGEGHRFNGLAVRWSGNFFGWEIGEDTLHTVLFQFGVPDSFGVKEDGCLSVTYEFGSRAYGSVILSVDIKEGKICRVSYTAAEETMAANVSPDVLTDFEQAVQTDYDDAETIYEWGIEDKVYYNPRDEGYDFGQVDAFVEDYLHSQGMENMTPDGVSAAWDEDSYVAYYIDPKQQKCCFVIHMWGDYWVDYEAGISQYADAVYCASCDFHEAEQTGNIIYHYDTAKGVTQETAYDAWGKRMADISYQYIEGVPVPFVTESWNLDTVYSPIWALCRGQKTWLYLETAVTDESGRIIGTEEVADISDDGELTAVSDGRVYLPHACVLHYDENGRLKDIQEEMQPYDIEEGWGWWDGSIDYSGQMEFFYREDGTLKEVEYLRSSYTHGTWDSHGTIQYDEQGRMIIDSYYVTHGGDASIYLYEGDEMRPWARVDWCSFMPGIESVSVFVPVE